MIEKVAFSGFQNWQGIGFYCLLTNTPAKSGHTISNINNIIYWHNNRHLGWSTFSAHAVGDLPCSSQPRAPTCAVWSWHSKRCFAPAAEVKGRLLLVVLLPYGYAVVMRPNKAETAGVGDLFSSRILFLLPATLSAPPTPPPLSPLYACHQG